MQHFSVIEPKVQALTTSQLHRDITIECFHNEFYKKTNASNLSKAHETHDSLNSFYSQVVLICLHPFCRNSPLKSAPQPIITIKTLKPTILEIQGHLKLLMLLPLKSSSPVLVMISSTSVPVFTLDETILDNHFLERYHSLTPACAV